MCEMIVRQLCMFLWDGTIGQFCTKLLDFWWYICPAKDTPWKVPLQNNVILFPFSSWKRSEIAKYTPKYESGIANVADKIVNM